MLKWLKMADQDRLLRHGLLVLVLTNISNVANLVFHMAMGRMLSKEEYGILASMLGIILLFATPMMALQNTMAHYARHLKAEGRPGDIRVLVWLWLRKLLIVLTPVLVLSGLMSVPIARFFHLESPAIVSVTALSVYVALLLTVFSGTLQGLESFGWMCLVSSWWGLLRLALGVGLVLWLAPLAVYAIASHGISQIFSLLLGVAGLWVLLPKAEAQGAVLESTDRYFFLSLTTILSFSVLMNSDTVLVKHFFADGEDYGDYARASTIARTLVFLVQPIVVAMFPKVVSRGAKSGQHNRTLLRAVLVSGAMILSGVLLCTWLPQIPLWILFKETAPSARMLGLVRGVCWAMAPLSLTYLLMNFELAQHRFACTLPLVLCAALYYAGAALFHGTLWQVILVFLAASFCSMAAMLWLLFRRPAKAPAQP